MRPQTVVLLLVPGTYCAGAFDGPVHHSGHNKAQHHDRTQIDDSQYGYSRIAADRGQHLGPSASWGWCTLLVCHSWCAERCPQLIPDDRNFIRRRIAELVGIRSCARPFTHDYIYPPISPIPSAYVLAKCHVNGPGGA